jgi:hypothetical protein
MAQINDLKSLQAHMPDVTGKTVTMGFDGFIDTIVKPIKTKQKHSTTYFQTIQEFGEYTLQKSAGNFSLELEEQAKKLGGNMPIMANAMAGWNMRINCIGTMGYPSIHPLFSGMPPNCNHFSFAEPGISTALEFGERKIILGEMSSVNAATWPTVKAAIPINKLIDLFSSSDLIALLNWAELDHATEIWEGIANEVLPFFPDSKRIKAFVDLSDCSKRSVRDIRDALQMLNRFGEKCDVILGLNRNEANLVLDALAAYPHADVTIAETGKVLFSHLKIDTVVIHHQTTAIAWNNSGTYTKESTPVDHPVLSTGAGDNFNAGFCTGLLANMDLSSCLTLGHIFASTYMKTGKSVTPT